MVPIMYLTRPDYHPKPERAESGCPKNREDRTTLSEAELQQVRLLYQTGVAGVQLPGTEGWSWGEERRGK